MIPPVVDRSWVTAHPGAVLADVRWYLDGRLGRAAFDGGHLPGAVFVDLATALAAPASSERGRHPLPEVELFAAAMASLGIGDGDVVVAYDDAGGVIAARLVWMLRATGHDAALLDGGIAGYSGELERASSDRPVAIFTAPAWPAERLAALDDAADPENVVIDARDRERFAGGPDPIDPRSGHIPGAKNVPCRENPALDGHFLPVETIREHFAAAGITGNEPVVSYCGSGVTACHNLLAMEHAGLGHGRLYPGSWSQYAARADLPIETGSGSA